MENRRFVVYKKPEILVHAFNMMADAVSQMYMAVEAVQERMIQRCITARSVQEIVKTLELQFHQMDNGCFPRLSEVDNIDILLQEGNTYSSPHLDEASDHSSVWEDCESVDIEKSALENLLQQANYNTDSYAVYEFKEGCYGVLPLSKRSYSGDKVNAGGHGDYCSTPDAQESTSLPLPAPPTSLSPPPPPPPPPKRVTPIIRAKANAMVQACEEALQEKRPESKRVADLRREVPVSEVAMQAGSHNNFYEGDRDYILLASSRFRSKKNVSIQAGKECEVQEEIPLLKLDAGVQAMEAKTVQGYEKPEESEKPEGAERTCDSAKTDDQEGEQSEDTLLDKNLVICSTSRSKTTSGKPRKLVLCLMGSGHDDSPPKKKSSGVHRCSGKISIQSFPPTPPFTPSARSPLPFSSITWAKPTPWAKIGRRCTSVGSVSREKSLTRCPAKTPNQLSMSQGVVREPDLPYSARRKRSLSRQKYYPFGRPTSKLKLRSGLRLPQYLSVRRHLNGLGKRLMKAAQEGRTKDVRDLLKEGADPNYTNKKSWTPLHMASLNCHTDVVSILLERGADVNARNAYGFSALHMAAYNDHSGDCVTKLIYAGGDLDHGNYSEKTPLHFASEYGNEAAVRALVAAGADKQVKNNDGKTPFEVARTACIRRLLSPSACSIK